MATTLVLLLSIVLLSFAPLAGTRGGWARFRMDNITSDVMVQLGLAPWNHYIDIGYNKVKALALCRASVTCEWLAHVPDLMTAVLSKRMPFPPTFSCCHTAGAVSA